MGQRGPRCGDGAAQQSTDAESRPQRARIWTRRSSMRWSPSGHGQLRLPMLARVQALQGRMHQGTHTLGRPPLLLLVPVFFPTPPSSTSRGFSVDQTERTHTHTHTMYEHTHTHTYAGRTDHSTMSQAHVGASSVRMRSWPQGPGEKHEGDAEYLPKPCHVRTLCRYGSPRTWRRRGVLHATSEAKRNTFWAPPKGETPRGLFGGGASGPPTSFCAPGGSAGIMTDGSSRRIATRGPVSTQPEVVAPRWTILGRLPRCTLNPQDRQYRS